MLLVFAVAACVALPAQQPGGAAPTPPAAAAPAIATLQAPAATAPTFGRIVADKVGLRCWSSTVASPPVFEETLAKDQVIAVGKSENGFRAVILPLGPLGFVSKKLTESTPDGVVKTKGTKVSFRYRPRSSEAPVQQLEDGTALHVIGEQDDWYRVRVPGVDAWVAEAEVAVPDQNDAALAKAYAELRGKHEAEVKARLDAIAAQRARETQDAADLAAVALVNDAFAAELKKDVGEQNYTALNEALDKLAGTLAEGSAGKPAIEALKKRIDTQRWIVEATAVRDAKPPLGDAPPPEKRDQLERFQSIGWLRYERRIAGPGIYYLEKGGQRLYLLSCNTGRYDLGIFVDHEVGVIGPRRRPLTESLSVLDIERLEVLGTAPK
ncbi:MAG: SH3 domain-containing protein [Planctomycetota bacterium]